MSDFWRWLLDLDLIPRDAADLTFGWERPFPAWVWAVAIFGLGLYAVWSYSGLAGRRYGRGALAMLRFLLLFGLVILLAGPTLIVPRVRIERDWVIALIDRSESMQIQDMLDEQAGRRISREEQLRAHIESLRESSMGRIANEHNIAWLGFDAGAYELETGEDGRIVLGEPEGDRTALGPAIDQAIRRLAARPISGIVVFSDGRTSDPPSRATLRTLQADAAPVFVAPLGSSDPIGDVAIEQIEAPNRAFAHDHVPVDVSLESLGLAGRQSGAVVSLIDQSSGETLDEIRVEPGEELDRVTLTAEPEGAGEARWVVRVTTDQPDLITENNERAITLEIVDRPLRVLFVEGYPRWEYRWLKDMLIREDSVDVSVFLVSADRDFAQEGNTPITRLPNSPEEFEPYDVIILGDVHAAYFSPAQLDMIRDHITDRGAGLLWMTGPRANPLTYEESALASLAPLRGSFALPPITDPITIEPTRIARRLGVLRLVQGEGDAWGFLSDPLVGWNAFQWALRIEPDDLKPTAEPLAVTTHYLGSDGEQAPVVIQMRYGAGQTVFVATDEIWRWRYEQGDYLPEQFWIQIIRLLGRDRLAFSGQAASLTIEPRRVEVGQPAIIELRIIDAALAEADLDSIAVEARRLADNSITDLTLTHAPGEADRYTTTFISDRAGEYEFTVRSASPTLDRLNLTGALSVFLPDDELQHPEPDHELLARLAEQTGGAVLGADDLDRLPELLPNRSVRTPMDITESLWDTPLVFIIFALLLTLEWVGRKVIRLL